MLKFQLTTPEDLKIAASIERRRQIDDARKSRIFNPRTRCIGIDKEFLDKQIAEKQSHRQLEREKEWRMDEALLRNSQLAVVLEHREEEDRRRQNMEINDFRKINQRPEDRRDFDLYDPDRLKKSLPARVDDDDPRLGPSSAQKFEGEDINQAERLRLQKEQMQAWLMQQVHERRANERDLQSAKESYENAVASRERRANALDSMEKDCRRRFNEATAKFNQTLAEEQEYRRRYENVKEEEDKRAEIYNHVTGDFLTEAKEQANSNRGPNKPIANRYKGMTSDELKVIWEDQARQMEEIRRMKLEEKEKNEEWDRLMQSNARAAEFYQRDLDHKRSQMNKQIAAENMRLAQQQKSNQDYLNQKVYKREHMPDFFDQFNTTAR